MYYNSTIAPKIGPCPLCNDGVDKPLIAGKCGTHYWNKNRMKSAAKAHAKAITGDKGFSALVDDLDAVYSRVIRLKEADENGIVQCYTCPDSYHWKYMDCGHFIPRDNMSTRFNEMNTKPQCKKCNQMKDGNEIEFAAHLERDRKGLVEMLQEMGRERQDYSRDELKQMFADYSRREKFLLKKVA